MKIKYQNEHLRKQVENNALGLWVLVTMLLLGIALCAMSFYYTYADVYAERELVFDDILGLADDSIYTVELTEMPEELYPNYYMVKVGDNAILATYVKDEVEQFRKTGHAKIKGVLQGFSERREDVEKAAAEYFENNNYYTGRDKLKARAAHYYLDCSDISFMDRLTDRHPVGLIFGITILIVTCLCMHWSRTLNVIKHLRPACGSVRYTPEEIDEQANRSESEWLPGVDMYVTPEILIGTNKGMTAVRYDDIRQVYIRPKWHTEAIPGTRRIRRGHVRYKYREYNTYQVIVVTKKNKKLKMCDSRNLGGVSLKKHIDERCGPGVWAEK